MNLAFRTNASLLDLIEEISEVVRPSTDVEFGPPRQETCRTSRADNATLQVSQTSRGWPPQGLTETLNWFKEQE